MLHYSKLIILFVDGYGVMIIILNYIEEKFMSLEENAQRGEKGRFIHTWDLKLFYLESGKKLMSLVIVSGKDFI